MGASPSYICGKDGVKVISGNSMPLGLLAEADVISFKEEINIGDIVVLMSDGILETGMKQEMGFGSQNFGGFPVGGTTYHCGKADQRRCFLCRG